MKKKPSYCTALAAWGDTFAACGNIIRLLRETDTDQVGVLHWGFDPHIATFLNAQPWVREARNIRPASPAEYNSLVLNTLFSDTPKKVWGFPLTVRSGIPLKEITPTHVNYKLMQKPIINRWHDAVLPEREFEIARDILNTVVPAGTKKLCLLNPISLQSVKNENHWPFWDEAVQWLLAETDYTFILTGHKWNNPNHFGEHPRLINLVNKTPTNMSVLALAQIIGRNVTTCNSLSLWNTMQRIQSVVCNNKAMIDPNYYFRLWISVSNNRVVQYDDGMDEFIRAAVDLLGA